MKKLLPFILLLWASVPNGFGQGIPNGNFENWTNSLLYRDPVYYLTSNIQSTLLFGQSNVKQTVQPENLTGNFGIKVETIIQGNDTASGFALIGQPGNESINGGIPFSCRPDTFSFAAKFNIQPNDTAAVLLILKKNGATLGYTMQRFTGSQSTYQYFQLPVYYVSADNPDTLSFVISSSNLDLPKVNGSTIWLDDFAFNSCSFPNGDLEQWNDINSNEPDGWFTANSSSIPAGYTSVQSTNDYAAGSKAVKITTTPSIFGEPVGYLTSGRITDLWPIAGFPVNSNPQVLHFQFKSFPAGNDTAILAVYSYKYNATTGNRDLFEQYMIPLPAQNMYMDASINLTYNQSIVPDSLGLVFMSSNFFTDNPNITLGSALYIDDITIDYYPLSSKNSVAPSPVKLSPNPINTQSIIQLINVTENNQVQLSDLSGKKVFTAQNTNQIDLSALSVKPGTYLVTVIESGRLSNFKIIIQ